MSMPEFPASNPDFTQEQALTMILSSIALEEVALSHIINAEGEKIQYILGHSSHGGCPAELEDILAVNKSVTNLLEMVMQNQLILKNKMEKVLEHLPKPSPPPVPPKPPCPPVSPCLSGCCPCIHPPLACFTVLPGMYGCGNLLQWKAENICDNFAVVFPDCNKIQLSRNGRYRVNLYIELCNIGTYSAPKEAELCITCAGEKLVSKVIFHRSNHCQAVIFCNTEIQIPYSVCYVSVLVHSPTGMQVRQGEISFT